MRAIATRPGWKRRRRLLGLSQRDVAQRIGCTRSHYANIENGRRSATGFYRRIFRVFWR